VAEGKIPSWFIPPARQPEIVPAPTPDAYIVRRLFEAQRRGDTESVIGLCDPDVEFSPLDGQRYHGRDGVQRFFAAARLGEMEIDAIPQVIDDEGSRVIVTGRLRVWSGGGLSDSPAMWCIEVEHGLVRKVVPYRPDESA
jgi:hypothetical protein